MDYMRMVDLAWPVTRRVMGGHTAIYRATNGRVGHHIPGFAPVLLLDHVGARSGARRVSPLVYTRDGENVVLVASKGGYPKHPAWFHNLMANPDATVQIGSRRLAVHAHKADASERERLWPMVVATYRGYEGYQRRTDREIPLVILEPRT